jgi:carbonic anhydrase
VEGQAAWLAKGRHFQFHFTDLKAAWRLGFCEAVRECPFTVRAVVMRKDRVREGTMLRRRGDYFVNRRLSGILARGGGLAMSREASVPAEEARRWLVEGNERFRDGAVAFPHHSPARRLEVAAGQAPFAAVLGCADSRVPPELVFDRGLGDLFVVRTAGHVVDDIALGSLEYAVDHLGVALLVVLGHSGCGAVAAAVDAVVKGACPEGKVARVLDVIRPTVHALPWRAGDLGDAPVHAHVRQTVDTVSRCEPALAAAVRHGRLAVVGAVYDLGSGQVAFLE